MGTTEIHAEIEADHLLQFLSDDGARLDTEAITATWTPTDWRLSYLELVRGTVKLTMVRVPNPEEGD